MFGAGFSNETDRGEFRGRGWRSPPSRGGRRRHALVVEAEIPILCNGGYPPRCSRGCPRHVACAKCCSSRDSSELPKDLTAVSISLLLRSKRPVLTRGLVSAGRRRFQDMSPFDTIAKAVYRRPLTVYVVSILVPVALTLALVRPRGKTFVPNGTLLSEFRVTPPRPPSLTPPSPLTHRPSTAAFPYRA